MKIGLVGESPHDTNSIANLLKKVYTSFSFVNLIQNIRGSQLDQLQPTKRILRIEYQYHNPDLVIFIRDLDGLADDHDQIELRRNYFREFRSVVNNRAVFMLNIYEIEALILCDLNAFKGYYSCECSCGQDPHTIIKPKEYLKGLYKHYREVDNAKIFANINHNLLLQRSEDYKRFIGKFERAAGILD